MAANRSSEPRPVRAERAGGAMGAPGRIERAAARGEAAARRFPRGQQAGRGGRPA